MERFAYSYKVIESCPLSGASNHRLYLAFKVTRMIFGDKWRAALFYFGIYKQGRYASYV